jgi:hypothetical protein
MSRHHPFFSRLGCLGGSVLILGIVVTVLMSGGAIFSPGTLTAWAENGTPLNGYRAHVEFQNDCGLCHAPFQGVRAERCEACHADIRAERESALGLHGRLAPEAAQQCGRCHEDHEGPDHNPSARAIREFDHAVAGFVLSRHIVDFGQAPLDCQACHTVSDFNFVEARCGQCHAAAQADFMSDHAAAFGQACTDCHDGVDRMHDFDHAQTRFPLSGRHAPLQCAACHAADRAPQDTPEQCAGCHAEPAVHQGVFGVDCAACHTPAAWTPAGLPGFPAFDHGQTPFQLVNHVENYDGTPFTCTACHSVTGDALTFAAQACLDCHAAQDQAFMTQHVQAYGANCVNCHDGAGNMRDFDHSRVFPLDGRHAGLACADCHVNGQFRGLDPKCVACHQEPEVHAGVFGLTCEACHTSAAWAPARLTRHTFPLDHGDDDERAGEIPCATCHPATYTEYTCFGCHEHDPAGTQRQHAEVALAGRPLEACAACHATGREGEARPGEP